MMPNVFGVSRVFPCNVVRADAADSQHMAAYMSYYFTYMLAISATADIKFPKLDILERALEGPSPGETKEQKRERKSVLATAKHRFGFMPGGFEVWDTPLMDALDAVFVNWFTSKGELLRPEFGIDHQRWQFYREDVVKAAKKTLSAQYSPDVTSRILARILWFLSDENKHHHYLPFPTATCLRLVGERLLECEIALTEVSC